MGGKYLVFGFVVVVKHFKLGLAHVLECALEVIVLPVPDAYDWLHARLLAFDAVVDDIRWVGGVVGCCNRLVVGNDLSPDD